MRSNYSKQAGGVSIFIVIFSALLITIVTVSFVSLMIRNQIQSSNADLSQSAYDSAMAGVEDAKRLMLVHRSCQDGSNTDVVLCTRVAEAMHAESDGWTACNTLQRGLYGAGASVTTEYTIRRTEAGSIGDAALNQAYTCVKIRYNTEDIEKTAKDGEATVIPVDTNGQSYDTIRLSWFRRAAGSTNNLGGGPIDLPSRASWDPAGTPDIPPIMRFQFIQVGASFNLGDFDSTNSTSTVFYKPSSVITLPNANLSQLALDNNRTQNGLTPKTVNCSSSQYTGGGYACSVDIMLPSTPRTSAYINIGAIYKDTDYKIELFNGGATGTKVKLAGVQPEVDATGRANDLFRRVSARVEFNGNFTYPDATLRLTGNLCKDFRVTDQPGDYDPSNSTPECSP